MSIIRNAILAAIGISLIISVAIFGSTVITQFHSASIHSPSSGGNNQSSTSGSTTLSSSSSTINASSARKSESTTTSSTSSSSSPTTEYPPASTVAEIRFTASAFAYDNYSKTIFVASNGSSGSILEINATTNSVSGQISLPSSSHVTSLIFDPDNRELYLALDYGNHSPENSTIAMSADNHKIVWNATTLGISKLSIDPVRNLIYGSGISHSGLEELVNGFVLNGSTNQVEKNFTLFETSAKIGEGCCYLGPLLYNSVTGFLYETIGVYGPDGGFSPFLAIFDTLTNTTISSGSSTQGEFDLSYNPLNGYTYAADIGYTSSIGAYNPPVVIPGGNITILNGSTPVSTISLGRQGQNESTGSIAYNPFNQTILVANGTLSLRNYRFTDQNITIIGASSGTILNVLSMPIGGITTMFFDPANLDLYVASPDTIYVISLPPPMK
jgi:hypothetical protein